MSDSDREEVLGIGFPPAKEPGVVHTMCLGMGRTTRLQQKNPVIPGSCKAWQSRLRREARAGWGSLLGFDPTGRREPAIVAEQWEM